MDFLRSFFIELRKFRAIFRFLGIINANLSWFQFGFPTLLTAFSLLIFWLTAGSCLALDLSKIITGLNSLLSILIGFYIASLAAVSSFNSDKLDQPIRGSVVKVNTTSGNGSREILTRRQFLSALFGYCAGLSVILYILGLFYANLTFSYQDHHLDLINHAINFVIQLLYLWLSFSLLVSTLLGLHYLIERMHRD